MRVLVTAIKAGKPQQNTGPARVYDQVDEGIGVIDGESADFEATAKGLKQGDLRSMSDLNALGNELIGKRLVFRIRLEKPTQLFITEKVKHKMLYTPKKKGLLELLSVDVTPDGDETRVTVIMSK